MSKFLPFILFTVFTNAAAQLMLKYGMIQLGPLSFAGVNPVLKILQIVFSPFVFLGLCTFVVSMASHLFVLSKVELSYAYPFLSLAYVAVAVFAYLLFKEDLNAYRIGGIALICVGTVFIAQGGSTIHGEDDLAALSSSNGEVSR
ncbi:MULTISPECIES: transporter [unclassified Aureimonas]|uniref:EamA family transporter n=1 Tax=unclassified Aureimonas TaxID=2615206 RepID=UPI0006F1E3E0|nr:MULTISPECIES: transporter [unclassified Aureimonas]KQT57306.1 transporter [Aureimonas sp. Leaf427]KQT76986.1 transporter [Aureimonas sp. Leaf460]